MLEPSLLEVRVEWCVEDVSQLALLLLSPSSLHLRLSKILGFAIFPQDCAAHRRARSPPQSSARTNRTKTANTTGAQSVDDMVLAGLFTFADELH